jgi:hypothetical protein
MHLSVLSCGDCFCECLAETRESKAGASMRISWMVAWLMAGAATGFLASNRVVIVFLGAAAAFVVLAVIRCWLSQLELNEETPPFFVPIFDSGCCYGRS